MGSRQSTICAYGYSVDAAFHQLDTILIFEQDVEIEKIYDNPPDHPQYNFVILLNNNHIFGVVLDTKQHSVSSQNVHMRCIYRLKLDNSFRIYR